MGRFNDKVVLITGSGSGMGKETAIRIAKEGAKVIVADRNEEGAKDTVQKIQAAGGEALALKVDITKTAEVENMIKQIVAKYGRLDCAVNNAGIEANAGETFEDTSEEMFDRVIGINVKGTWTCMKYELIQMQKQGQGVICNVASVLGIVGIDGFSSYVASKHAIVGLTKCAAIENARKGIRVNACCPAAVRTPMLDRADAVDWDETTPMKRVGRVDEVANGIMFLISDESTFTTGHTLLLDGGIAAS